MAHPRCPDSTLNPDFVDLAARYAVLRPYVRIRGGKRSQRNRSGSFSRHGNVGQQQQQPPWQQPGQQHQQHRKRRLRCQPDDTGSPASGQPGPGQPVVDAANMRKGPHEEESPEAWRERLKSQEKFNVVEVLNFLTWAKDVPAAHDTSRHHEGYGENDEWGSLPDEVVKGEEFRTNEGAKNAPRSAWRDDAWMKFRTAKIKTGLFDKSGKINPKVAAMTRIDRGSIFEFCGWKYPDRELIEGKRNVWEN